MHARVFSRGARPVPVLRSAEAAECALTCLAMVLSHFGHHLSVEDLRGRFRVSLAGSSLQALLEAAQKMGLTARAVRVDVDDLRHLSTPAILHWRMHHFVVLVHVKGNKYIIHDPAKGRCVVERREVDNAFTGVCVELSPSPTFQTRPKSRGLGLRDLWSNDRRLWGALGGLLTTTVALQALAILVPLQVQLTVDQGIALGDLSLINAIGIAFILIIALHAVMEGGRMWAANVLGAKFSYHLLGNVVSHLVRLKASYFESRHLGDILSRIQSSRAIQDFLTRGAVTVCMDGLLAAVALVFLLIYSPALTLIVIVGALSSGAVAAASYLALRSRTQAQLDATAREQTYLMESLRSATTLKILGREAAREASWRNLLAESLNAALTVSKSHTVFTSLRALVRGTTSVLLLWTGALIVVRGDGLSLGMLLAFLSFSQTFGDRFGSLMTELVQFKLLRVHLDRLADIVLTPAEDFRAISPPIETPGDIVFHNVGFRYGASERPVLDKASLIIAPGEYVGIMGRSGAGKSTFVKLLLGLISPDEGTIRLGGLSADDAVFRAWRGQVGVVTQEDRLFSGTIEDNIAFFEPTADAERVRIAAGHAHVLDEILDMPMGFRTVVGDLGASLSAGQKQRILLARALYRQPKVLVLDEGTANLDQASEVMIGDTIRRMSITRIIVSHRPLLLDLADRVLIMEGGRFQPVGTEVLKVEGAAADGVGGCDYA